MVRTAASESQRADRRTAILSAVAEILTESGYDRLQLRDVARRARASLSTVYEHFPSRDALMLAAIERWAEENVYQQLPPLRPEDPLCDRLVRYFRALLAPWICNPRMLEARVRVALLPTSDSLWRQGIEAARPEEHFAGYDPKLRDDVSTMLRYMTSGLLSSFASGSIDATEMLRVYERAVVRLTADAEPLARPLV